MNIKISGIPDFLHNEYDCQNPWIMTSSDFNRLVFGI